MQLGDDRREREGGREEGRDTKRVSATETGKHSSIVRQ